MRDSTVIANIDYLLLGMFEAQYAASKDFEKKQEAFARSMYKDIRESIDTMIPNIHILDTKKLSDILIKGLIEYPDTLFEGLFDDDRVAAAKAIITKNSPKIRQAIQGSIKSLFDDVYIPNLLSNLNTELGNILDRMPETLSPASIQEVGKKYYEVLSKTFGKSALLSTHSDDIILDKSTTFIFMSRTFEGNGKRRINETVTKAIVDIFKNNAKIAQEFDTVATSSFIGEFSNYGHTAVKSETGDIRINSPALIKAVFNTSNAAMELIKVGFRDRDAAERIFIRNTGHTKTAISVSKNFSQTSGMLLTFAISFTSDMEEAYNKQVLGSKEKRQLDRSSPDRLNSNEFVRQALKERVEYISGSLDKFADTLRKAKSSPSFNEYIETSILAALVGKEAQELRQVISKSKSASVNKVKVNPNKFPKLGVQSRRSEVSKAVDSFVKSTVTSSTIIPLTSLQVLINNNLAAQIKKNMGTGAEKSVLNYRTGRLASSAEVKRMSQSREGMITAFYTYMKYPYATFSEGGQQQYPRSRDPKLLISRSIREIAAEVVKNRMRAVLV